MSCYHPISAYRWKSYIRGETGIAFSSARIPAYASFWEDVKLPCGQCIGCRLDYSRHWADRLMLELSYYTDAWFVTLTYNDAHVPRSWYADPETGEAFPAMTLVKRDVQLFMKRLRKRYSDQKIRFFLCGEYGDKSLRPHYHVILFGLKLDDLQFYKRASAGDLEYAYFKSPGVQACWRTEKKKGVVEKPGDEKKRDIGYVVLGKVTWEACAYVARYMVKKLKGQAAERYDLLNIQPEFVLMSRKPGIARQYYDDHPDMFEYDCIDLSTPNGGRKIYPPKYYKRLFELDEPDAYTEYSERILKRVKEKEKMKLSLTDKDYYDMLKIEEELKYKKSKMLRRIL